LGKDATAPTVFGKLISVVSSVEALEIFESIEARQVAVDERVVRIKKIENAFILLHQVAKEGLSFDAQRFSDVRVEDAVGVFAVAGSEDPTRIDVDGFDIPRLKPLADETADETSAPVVLEQTINLGAQIDAKFTLRSEFGQTLVGE
jgi:hypothetical protein